MLAPSTFITPSSTGWEEYLRNKLGGSIEVESAADLFGRSGPFSVRFNDGKRVGVQLSQAAFGPPAHLPGVLLASLAFLALAIALFSLWASRALTAPLARFARVAEEFSLDGKGAALAESGPEEVRILAGALNRLQARIHSMVEDRTRMIAAVGHDLRTPITRLRLKAEFIEDQATRGPIIRDLEQMNAMVHGAMSYLRDGTGGTVAPTDLAILLQTVCDEFSDMGHKVNYIGPDHLVAAAQADDLQRAVANLVENAIKHGTETTVGLERSSDSVTLAVVDNGPGIPAGDKQLVLKPFARGDDARSLDGKTGFGLGLSIADAVARAHRGRLDLLDNQPQGLIARIQIPA
jgi:signal transduction histidine kinase